MKASTQVIVGLLVMAAVLFGLLFAEKGNLEDTRRTVDHLHMLFPCKEGEATVDRSVYGTVKFGCYDDRQYPQYTCAGSTCMYACVCRKE